MNTQPSSIWRVYVPYMVDAVYEIEAETDEEAIQKHWDGESNWIHDTDAYDSDQDPTVELHEVEEEKN